jgi:hypothetical protein
LELTVTPSSFASENSGALSLTSIGFLCLKEQ